MQNEILRLRLPEKELFTSWHRQWQGECYSIILNLKKHINIQIGRLGWCVFPEGMYLYTGRAKRGIYARIQRHQRKEKTKHWHIDYLTAHPHVNLTEAIIYSVPANQECAIHQQLAQLPYARIIIPGFGASDCRSCCHSHLLHFMAKPNFNHIDIDIEPGC